jgi:FecR protein
MPAPPNPQNVVRTTKGCLHHITPTSLETLSDSGYIVEIMRSLHSKSGTTLILCLWMLAVPAFAIVLVPLATDARGSSIAAVRYIQGGLTVKPPNQPQEHGKVKQPLYNAYFLQTRTAQKASLAFTDGSKLHINQVTDMVLVSLSRTVVNRGEVDEVVTPGTHHTIATANAVAAALGTELDVRITSPTTPSSGYGSPPAATPGPLGPPGTTTVSVTKGTVTVSNQYGSVQVHRGEWTHVRPGLAPSKPTRHNARADIAWTGSIPP